MGKREVTPELRQKLSEAMKRHNRKTGKSTALGNALAKRIREAKARK